jgi:flagellar basal body rod protein FlgG
LLNSIAIAGTGMAAANAWMSAIAGNVANASTPGYATAVPTLAAAPALGGVVVAGVSASGGPVDLSVEIPSLLMATDFYALNAAVAQRAASTYQDIANLGTTNS